MTSSATNGFTTVLNFIDGRPRIFASAALLLLVILVIYYLHNAGWIGKGGKKKTKRGRRIETEEDLDAIIDSIHDAQDAGEPSK